MFSRKAWAKYSLAAVFALLALAVVVALVTAFPDPAPAWLTIKGIGDDTQAQAYYTAIGAPATFSAWLTTYGFTSSNDVRAIYYNAADLGFGREMHCRQISADVACYVINHGLGPGAPAQLSVGAAIANQDTLPAVAMVYKDALHQAAQPNDVQFFIYNVQNGQRLNGVGLDGQGTKFAPFLCLACHGGSYPVSATQIQGARFLPFDAASFRFSGQAGYTLADQQEPLRQLNALVRGTNPATVTAQLIDGWYTPGGVNTPGSTFHDAFVPPSYSGTPADTALYETVVKHDCRLCHIAQTPTDLSTPGQLSTARSFIFGSSIMPHAQLTNHNFWSSGAPAFLANNQGWSLHVTRTDDPALDGCLPGDCSLREAVIAANASPGSIITFDLDGTFALATIGADEDAAATGDLDLTSDVTVLGNGPSRTIVDGGGLDRVFQVLSGAHATILGVTIQGGSPPSGSGAGIDNEGSFLDLVGSVVTNNYVSSPVLGAAVGSNAGATTHIIQSTLGPNNGGGQYGGGLYNSDSTLTLDNSTISQSWADYGSAVYNVGTGAVVTLTHATLTGNNYGLSPVLDNEAGSTLYIGNSLVTGNTSGNCLLQPGSNNYSLGYNLVGGYGSADGCLLGPNDQVVAGNPAAVVRLFPVANETGLQYNPLIPGSPAIDSIPVGAGCTLPSYDQANTPRPVDGGATNNHACDAGAREFVRALVNTNLDLSADDGLCSLREAVTAADTGQASGVKGGECPAGPDEIILNVPGPYTLTGGQLTVDGDFVLGGRGNTIRQAGTSRLFEVLAGGHLNLVNVTLSDGVTPSGPCSVPPCAALSGGAIVIDFGGEAVILKSAIVNNGTAFSGGGLFNLGVVEIANSTISGNSAGWDGGGLFNGGSLFLSNVTIANNTADSNADGTGDGGGLSTSDSAFSYVKGSLIAGNFDLSSGASVPDVYFAAGFGALTSYDYNLVGNGTGAAGLFNQPHDKVGTTLAPIDPRLGSLTGAPPYLPLLDGSPALDQIPAADCTFSTGAYNTLYIDGVAILSDQRGAPRPVNATGGATAKCDSGAFEKPVTLFLSLIRK